MSLFLAIGAAVLIYCAMLAGVSLTDRRKLRLEGRLKQLRNLGPEEKDRAHMKKIRVPGAAFLHVPQKIKSDLITSGIRLRPEEYVMMWICATLIPSILAFLLGGALPVCLLLIFLGVAVPPLLVSMTHKKRVGKFSTQLGDALMIISNSLRAGFSFEQSLANISKDLPDPLGPEFAQAIRELDMGADLETVLSSVAERMQSRDMELLNTAVVIQRQVGGNLAEIIDSISETIRNRIAIKRNIKVLTAQGRISGRVIGALPVFLLVVISMLNPEYIEPLFTTAYGHMMLALSATLEIVGFLVILKLVNLKY